MTIIRRVSLQRYRSGAICYIVTVSFLTRYWSTYRGGPRNSGGGGVLGRNSSRRVRIRSAGIFIY